MIKRSLFILCWACLQLTANAQWSLSGNAISAGNFLGTTNAQSLIFNVNSHRGAVIDASGSNTGLGVWNLGYPGYVGGSQNSGFGNNALANITSAAYANTAVGYLSLTAANNSGNTNTGVGIETLYRNTTGGANTAAGSLAMYYNTSGSNNNAFGVNALQQNTNQSYNNIMGSFAGFSTTTQGSDLCAMGDRALYSCSSGFINLAIGSYAAYNTTMAFNNVSIGSYSMYNNINQTSQYGSTNVAVGGNSLYNVGDGIWNAAVGYNALHVSAYTSANSINSSAAFGWDAMTNTNATVGGSVGFGASALIGNTSGDGNTAVGYLAMAYNTTGRLNTAIGSGAGPGVSYPGLTNATAIGYQATNFASNQVVIGNTSMATIGGFSPWVILSDGRYKKNVQENVPGLAYLNKLRPVTYNVDVTGLNAFMKSGEPSDQAQVLQKERRTASGFIAQEVEATGKSVGFDFNAVQKPESTTRGLYGLSYEQFVVPLVKAAQELSKDNDNLQNTIAGLQSKIDDLKQQMIELARTSP